MALLEQGAHNHMSLPPELLKYLDASRYIAILTGAGISAESGIPTFRDAQTGLWAQYRAEDLATPQAFQRNPKLVWDWYAMRRERVGEVQPNAGHLALAEWERRLTRAGRRYILITQNVDGLHRRAGSQQVIELHGNITRVKCAREEVLIEDWAATDTPPRCPHCGSYLRPDVVWFGENLPPEALQAALTAAQQCDTFFSIGTSGLVEPAASLPWLAREHGAVVVEVNPNPTPLTEMADYALAGAAGEVLPALVQALAK
jgi:NAD-dependent deacetylase